jgi:hypothetical protein
MQRAFLIILFCLVFAGTFAIAQLSPDSSSAQVPIVQVATQTLRALQQSDLPFLANSLWAENNTPNYRTI